MANKDLNERFLKGQTILAISVKQDSSQLWKNHRVYAFPNIAKSYPYLNNLMKDMYITFMHQGYINRLYKLDNHYVMKPFEALNGNILSHERHKDSISDYVKERMNTKFKFDQSDVNLEYMFFTFYPDGSDIVLSHHPRYLANGNIPQGFRYFAMDDLLDKDFPEVFPESISGTFRKERMLKRSKISDIYQDEVDQLLQNVEISFVPVDKPEMKPHFNTIINSNYTRDPQRGRNAIVYAGFLCEIDSGHQDFISATTNRNYIEGHHLIPIQFQRDYSYSLDVEANIVALCVTCHKKLHHGKFEDKKNILETLFQTRSSRLYECEIKIDKEYLLNLYK